LTSIYFGVFTNAGVWIIIALAIVYVLGSTVLFYVGLSRKEQLNLETVEVSYGRTYWVPIVAGFCVSILFGVFYFIQVRPRLSSAILIGGGIMMALTAFVSPKFNEKTRLDNADEFG